MPRMHTMIEMVNRFLIRDICQNKCPDFEECYKDSNKYVKIDVKELRCCLYNKIEGE